ncbi:hypothetical protein BS50DRAFT_633283 [Corynespora cassiicola Philippines]|uniref:Uncharacterized protein n=1 Tax=Corynespora cassiicola Philippines TaxID=1448308 RepID=A0A2T2NQ76_CORCC|nr:hypothetical protein BS50DRAFT_633283 [Corynespora cassiicola Philippines]
MSPDTIKTDGIAPSILTVAPRSILRRLLRWLCLCLLVLTAVLVAASLYAARYVVFDIVLPMRRAYYLETRYQWLLESTTKIQPLINDAGQLYFWKYWETKEHKQIDDLMVSIFGPWLQNHRHCNSDSDIKTYQERLGLFPDGTAWPRDNYDSQMMGREREHWIYLAGTSPGEESVRDGFNHPFRGHDCIDDPPYICEMYREAFDKVAERWHGLRRAYQGPESSSRPGISWANCDVNPLLCDDLWGLHGSNILVHMKVEDDCEDSLGYMRCGVSWRYFGIPMLTLPWTRMIRIPLDRGGSTVVPAFPSAEEQLWSIMAHAGAYEGINITETSPNNAIYTTTPDPEHLLFVNTTYGLAEFGPWGFFRMFVDTPWSDIMDSGTEFFIRCNVERWADIFLARWDGAKADVAPRDCQGEVWLKEQVSKRGRDKPQEEWENLEKNHEQKERMRDVWDETMKKQGLDPDWIYDQDDETSEWARNMLGAMGVGFW